MHSVTSLLSAISMLLIFCSRSLAATEIPFEFRDGFAWVKVSVPGKAEALNFVLDSGASSSVIDLASARNLGAKLGSPESVNGVHTRATAYRTSGLNAEMAGSAMPRTLLALDLGSVSAVCGRRIDGLVGADFFRSRVVQIDFAARKLRLLSRVEARAAKGESIPLIQRNGAFCVRVSVSDQPAQWTRVDTGCNSSLEWVASPRVASKSESASIALTSDKGRAMIAGVQIGSQRIEAVNIGVHHKPIFAGESGLLGTRLLSRFKSVTFDPAGKRLLVARN